MYESVDYIDIAISKCTYIFFFFFFFFGDESPIAERLREVREPRAGVRAERRTGLDDGEDRQPEHVEIGEVDDLAVEIGAPVAVDDAEQEEAGEAGRSPACGTAAQRRRRECMKPSPPVASPTPSVECIMTTRMMQMPLA